eukprot:CAMPEP_0178849870 /NCGR_PEP_ID=MMETSP0746-20121128/20190_1 /TAXON_ID=913974 /ORGANISM="Nitzschia punctata, Strain CCMP561" /LENGTH=72 /DNA_ID=CAMNT_0020515139 /DNA_START=350 /DNA_END=567 /DNA_ORIENTATION=+
MVDPLFSGGKYSEAPKEEPIEDRRLAGAVEMEDRDEDAEKAEDIRRLLLVPLFATLLPAKEDLRRVFRLDAE